MDKSWAKDKRKHDKSHKGVHNPKASTKSKEVKSTTPSSTAASTTATTAATTTPITSDSPYEDENFSKRKIVTNWKKYETDPNANESEDEQLNAADFEKLLRMPVSAGGHFFFSTEKNWETDKSESTVAKSQYSKYFKIDTKLLNASLKSIPFYSRQNYDKDLFSKSEINCMNLIAETNETKYVELCANKAMEKSRKMEKKNDDPSPIFTGEVAPPQPDPCLLHNLPPDMPVRPLPTPCFGYLMNRGNSATSSSLSTQMGEVKINEDVVGKVPAIVEVKPASVPNIVTTQTAKEDIQQWLDDILDI